MSWDLQQKEFENARRLPARERYEYCIKKVTDEQEIWSLWNDGWALLGDDTGELVSVWPHSRFAEAYAVGDWKEYRPKRIGLDEWLIKWIPGMEADHFSVAVFPEKGTTTTVSPSRLKQDLEAEMAKYELEE